MRKNKKGRWILVSVCVALVVVAGLGGWYFLGHRTSEPVNAYPFMYLGMTEYWGDSQESYGPVTTDHIQTVFLSGTQTVTEILDFLKSKGITTTKGTAVNYGTIQRMLNNRRYIGEYTFQDITIPDGIPAIIPQDLFDRVQDRLAKNRKAPARAKAVEN